MTASSRRTLLFAVAALTLTALAWWNLRDAGTVVIGGPFNLVTHEGTRLSDRDLRGKPFAVFFGFTQCPVICPTALMDLSTTLQRLGPDADKMRFLFISVDPERDTQEHLKRFLSSFDPRITGLTGTPEEIAAVAKSYRAYYEKVPTSDSYTMNHTTTTYLMGRNGELAGTISYQTPPEQAAASLKRLIGAP